MKTNIILAATLAATLAGCSSLPGPGAGSVTDAGTTGVALVQGFAETNPALSWAGDPITTTVLSLGVKTGLKGALAPIAGETQADIGVETVGLGAGMWNLGLLAGANPAVGSTVAIISVLAYYRHRQDGVPSEYGAYTIHVDDTQHSLYLGRGSTLAEAREAALRRYGPDAEVEPTRERYVTLTAEDVES